MTLQPRTATASRSGEIFLAFGNAGLFTPIPRQKPVIAIYQEDLSTLSHILFLQFFTLRRLLPLEMTSQGKSRRDKYNVPERWLTSFSCGPWIRYYKAALYDLCAAPPLLAPHSSLFCIYYTSLDYLSFFTNSDTVSTCMVCGNISTGWTSFVS